MVARDENRNRNGHVLVWEQAGLGENRNIKPDSMYQFQYNFFLLLITHSELS